MYQCDKFNLFDQKMSEWSNCRHIFVVDI